MIFSHRGVGSGRGRGILVWKLLRKHVSAVQLGGFFVTNLIGVAIILASVQLWRDVKPVVEAPDSFLSNDFMIISRGDGGAISHENVADLSEQPFVKAVGEFTPARYSVSGGISVMGTGFETYLFFESVPDRFLDVETDRWAWHEGDTTIPIILPRNYLNIYNFGFASTQGLPRVTEAVVESVPMKIVIAGRQSFEGRVVAFSNRLNTILVPRGFIEWSNAEFADHPAGEPLRLIVEVPNSSDENLATYLSAHNLITEGDRAANGRAGRVVRVAAVAVGCVGGVVAVLSIFILMLSIFLLLQKNTRKIEDLLLMGYSPWQVSRPYIVLTVTLNLLVLGCAIPIVIYARERYIPFVEMLADSFSPPSILPTILWGLMAVVMVSAANIFAIRGNIRKIWTLRK